MFLNTVYFQFLFLSRDQSKLKRVLKGLTKKTLSDCLSIKFTGQITFVSQRTMRINTDSIGLATIHRQISMLTLLMLM